MVTIKGLNEMINALYYELINHEVEPHKVILFGSYAKGNPKAHSDIDLAIWSKDFTGFLSKDIERIATIKGNYPLIELHTYSLNDTEENDPFIEEILLTGKEWKVDKPIVFM